MTRHAACSCGQLHLTIEGEPSPVAICHCLGCQRRTGAVISNHARFKFGLEAIFTGEDVRLPSGTRMSAQACAQLIK